MAAPSTGGGPPIESKQQLVEWFEAGCKPPEDWRIGTEHEKFAFRIDDLSALSYDSQPGIRDLLEHGFSVVHTLMASINCQRFKVVRLVCHSEHV